MMYNGIGLTTPRGSGTNGYIQNNKAHIRAKKRPIDYQSEEELKKSEKLMFREPNKDILEHERKRRIESKCFELQDLMEEDGYTAEEIKEKVEEYREALLRDEFSGNKNDEKKKLFGLSTHVLAAATQQKNELLRSALKINPDFEDGSSLNKKIRKEAEKEKSEWLESDSSSSSSSSDSSSSNSSDSETDEKRKSPSPKHKSKRKHSSSKSKSKKRSHKKSLKKKSKKSKKKSK